MCGINGIISKSLRFDLDSRIKKMNNEIIHRGPDDEGVHIYNNENYSVGIGMRRLSIIDIENGSQPIFSDDRSISLVFNGEIYNYIDLKTHLIKKFGLKFKTKSDTEVILKLYEKYGTKSFSMLEGMFAFSIVDINKNKIFIARDFFGEKPIYYCKENKSIIWSSELKSLLKVKENQPRISKKAVSLYFQLTYIPAPYSIYEQVYKVEPYNFIEIDNKSLSLKIVPIINKIEKDRYKNLSYNDAVSINHDLVLKSVKSRSISDVPLGTFLSGGVDSSIVSLCLSKLKNNPIDTFSMGFEKKSFDETKKSKLVSKIIGSNHHEFVVTINSMKSHVNDLIVNFDEPFADSSAIPTFMVSKLSRTKVKVALTGDGGDEVYGGYNKYLMGIFNKRYTNYVSEKLHKKILACSNFLTEMKNDSRGLRYKIRKLMNSVSYNDEFYFNIVSLGFRENELNELLINEYHEKKSLNKLIDFSIESLHDFREVDKKISLEGDMLVKVDRTSMFTSLECRAPFLNKEIWNFTKELPEKFLMNGLDKKILLKDSFKKYFPVNFLDKSKKGFGIPVGDWLRDVFKDELLKYSKSDFLLRQKIFKVNYIKKLVSNHLSGVSDNTFKVWAFYCFQKWYLNNFKN